MKWFRGERLFSELRGATGVGQKCLNFKSVQEIGLLPTSTDESLKSVKEDEKTYRNKQLCQSIVKQ